MKIKHILVAYYSIKQYFIHIVMYLWLIMIKNNWNKLYIRKDEFHSSLDINSEMMNYMNEKEREKYMMDLVRRRNIAHERELNNCI